MNNRESFDAWWERRYGFAKVSHPLYATLKHLHSLGADLDYLLRLTTFIMTIDDSLSSATRSKPNQKDRGVEWKSFLKGYGWLFRQFGIWVYIETLKVSTSIHRAINDDARAIAGPSLLTKLAGSPTDVVKERRSWPGKSLLLIAEKITEVLDKAFSEFENEFKQADCRHQEEIASKLTETAGLIKARPLGNLIYEYAFVPLKYQRGKPSAAWKTLFLLAVTEHLRNKSPDRKPHFSDAARLLEKLAGKNAFRGRAQTMTTHRLRRTARERVDKLKKSHREWKQHVDQLENYLSAKPESS